jgi:hypothetical protein
MGQGGLAEQRPRFVLRAALACLALTVSLFALASPAWSAPYENVPTPTIEGPIPVTETSHPFLATNIPLANYGYTEQEYFISGTGYTYNTGGAINVNGTKILTGGPNENGTYPFKTRIVVRRPEDPAKFNGKVIVEWQNVTAGYDLEANWFGDPYYLLRHGYAYVTVSAQNVGVNYLKKTFNPTRYGSLEVGPTGDALSYDIFGSAIKAIRGDGVGPEPLGNLTPSISKVTASGESQSCGRLVTYFNKIAPLHEIVDNYLLTVCTTAIRADRPEKVLRVITEFENKEQQTEAEAPANPSLRHWEATGGSHVPFDAAANWAIPVERDTGPDIADCTNKPVLSKVQWPFIVNTGIKDLDEWSEGGEAPPIAPRGEYESPKVLKRNSLGIALGGIRLPEVEVPVAVNLAENTPAPPPNPYPDSAFCVLLGQSKPLSEATLGTLYSDFGEYVEKVKADTDKLELEGFVSAEDAQRLVETAEEVPRLAPTTPATSGSSLGWRGPVPSHPESQVARFVETHPEFEVQHRPAPGGEWTTVASGLSSPTYSLAGEEEGTWNYRVRSSTVLPAYAIEPEETVVSPWSQASSAIKVISGNVKGKLTVNAGEAVELTPTAKASGTVTVKAGGALAIDGAKVSGTLMSRGATSLSICGAMLSGPVKALDGSGPVVFGGEGCAPNTFHGNVTVNGNTGGVTIEGNTLAATLKVQGNSGGTTVTGNTVAGSLTVTGNAGSVTDTPNEVEGKQKLQ